MCKRWSNMEMSDYQFCLNENAKESNSFIPHAEGCAYFISILAFKFLNVISLSKFTLSIKFKCLNMNLVQIYSHKLTFYTFFQSIIFVYYKYIILIIEL